MKFGVFDHMDRSGAALQEQYESRLRLTAAYDAAGFHMYHVAEHHSTPLGMSPSPSVFLSAVAQRTKRLRFGPLVYPIALYHPIRLAEEIAMLDHMSGGRFEFGVGKGASHHELLIFGVAQEDAEPQYAEALQVLTQALTQERVDFAGKYYTCRDVPVVMHPLQRPHPPMWYGVSRPDSAGRAAKNHYNFVCNMPASQAKSIMDAYRTSWQADGNSPAELPLMGIGRFLVLAESNKEAMRIANRAYPQWNESFWKLWDAKGGRPSYVTLPTDFEGLEERGIGLAGTPEKVRASLAAQMAESGSNYLVCRFAFGNLTLEESLRSLDLFTREVMPALSTSGS